MLNTRSTLKFVEPMVPSPSDDVPEGDDWIHEVKYDGYRAQIIKDEGGVRVFTRNGYDWSSKFWPIALEARTLPCTSAIIDGEVIVTDEKGASHFPSLPEAIRTQPSRLVFVAFDLLHLDGEDLRGVDIPSGAVLAFGSERHGLSDAVRARAARVIAIPIRDRVSSYNLATSVAVALYAWTASRPR